MSDRTSRRFTLGEKLDVFEVEKVVREYWKENGIPTLWRRFEEGKPIFSFLEGPPTVNGYPHVGHIRGRTYKDVVLRYHRLKGYVVWAQGGWDEQGLPVEIEVEKKLRIKRKKDIEAVGLDRFSRECDELVNYYLRYWRDIGTERLGLWLDLEGAYETRAPGYIEHIWAFVKEMHKRGLLFQDYRVLAFCPRCETALSDAEVDLGYELKTSPSIFVKFKVLDQESVYLVIWTTTPWTLIDNESVAVHSDGDYVKVEVEFDGSKEYWIVAEPLVHQLLLLTKVASYRIVEKFKGNDLRGLRYRHPLEEEVPIHKNHVHRVTTSTFVSLSEGTGLVHIAPAHGPEDFELAKAEGIEFVNTVEVNGVFNENAGAFSGLYYEEANKKVIEVLKKSRLLLYAGSITHSYPHCWRCGTPLIYRTDVQYFLRITAVKDRMIDELSKVNIYPRKLRDRFDNWVANSKDWCISRSRIWGTPLPIWRDVKNGNVFVIGSLEELRAASATQLSDEQITHRPWIDHIKLYGSNDIVRDHYVLDVWLDSGLAWIASVEGLRNAELWSKLYPFDFVTEAVDQTRGWFYSLLATSVLWQGRAPYKNVLIQGLVLDKHGQKMSKSRGNVIWAEYLFNKFGVDPVRLYLCFKVAPWDDLAFNEDEVRDIVNRYLTIIYNVFKFADTYMELDHFDPKLHSLESTMNLALAEDLWILSSYNSLIKKVEEAMKDYEIHTAAREVLNFLVELVSHRYIRLIRRRVWYEDVANRYAAYAVLYEVLKGALIMMSPFIPHISEYLYQAFVRKYEKDAPISVHLASWPTVNESYISAELESAFESAFEVLSNVSSLRNKIGVKIRWPLRDCYVVVKDSATANRVASVRDIVEYLCNVKKLYVTQETPSVREGEYEVKDLGWCTVYLNKVVDKDLYYEALARELIRRIQVMRNRMRLSLDEVVTIAVETKDEEIAKSIEVFKDYLLSEVRADGVLSEATPDMFTADWDIDGKKVKIGVKRRGL